MRPPLRRRKAMAPWCFNECFRRGWVPDGLVMYLCDDDLLYPNAFMTFVDAFRANPAAMAMFASQDIGFMGQDGRLEIVGERRALTRGGSCCDGRIMDCQVDYLQLCHRRAALDAFSNDEYWPEDMATGGHADGLFMEKLGSHWPILPVDVKVGQNRRTPWSVNLPLTPSESLAPPPVHETVMDAWTNIRSHLEEQATDGSIARGARGLSGPVAQALRTGSCATHTSGFAPLSACGQIKRLFSRDALAAR